MKELRLFLQRPVGEGRGSGFFPHPRRRRLAPTVTHNKLLLACRFVQDKRSLSEPLTRACVSSHIFYMYVKPRDIVFLKPRNFAPILCFYRFSKENTLLLSSVHLLWVKMSLWFAFLSLKPLFFFYHRLRMLYRLKF